MKTIETHRQAILTRYHGPTNIRGSRISAQWDGGRRYYPYDHSLNISQNHAEACARLATELGWFNDIAENKPMRFAIDCESIANNRVPLTQSEDGGWVTFEEYKNKRQNQGWYGSTIPSGDMVWVSVEAENV